MNTREVAELLGIAPKTLRRHLRSHARWAASGTRYEFSDADVELLRVEMNRPADKGDDDVPSPFSMSDLADPASRPARRRQRTQRQAVLRDRLIELSLWGKGGEE